MDVGVPRCWNGDPAHVKAALVGPQHGGQTTSNESLGAAGSKRTRTVDFGTLYKRPMSSSGLQSVEVMMMMMMMMNNRVSVHTSYFLGIANVNIIFILRLLMLDYPVFLVSGKTEKFRA
ncbi:jg8022 [Pararge aegeria aegeria]|uniref:Jg8022 protein n=1 Tax=Pararge aegeria aegeria TaxID=348720 RepID=A0A8S4RKP6_9NEOP|nr:jg8022 [Pararge aegeria aegeria]